MIHAQVVMLDRPRVINALSLEMLRELTAVLADFAADPQVERVELSGTGERGLCSGADVREIRELVLNGGDVGEFFRTEYQLNLAIWNYSRKNADAGQPADHAEAQNEAQKNATYTAWMLGVTMGGGLGISAHGNDRVVGADSVLAMPETKIGLFPDVLMTWHFARMPRHIGTHLALTGNTFGAADALWLGLADRCETPLPQPAPLLAHVDWIEECYAADSVPEIIGRLAQHSNSASRETATLLRTRCPLSLAVTLEALRRSSAFTDISQQYAQDLNLAIALTTAPDFAEGVRALLVDRDQTPHWSHSSPESVPRPEVLACFQPGGSGDVTA